MKTFDTTTKLKLARLQAGQFVETHGYSEKGGSGAGKYLVKTNAEALAAGDTLDNETNLQTANGNWAIALGYSKSEISSAVTSPLSSYGKQSRDPALQQNDTDGRLYNPKAAFESSMFGMETLEHWFSKFAQSNNQNNGNAITAKIVGTGDSTMFGVNSGYGGIPAILQELAKMRGYVNVNVVNNGRSGEPLTGWPATSKTTSWESTYLADDIAQDPDLLIVRWGANDPFYNVSPLGSTGGSPVDDRDTVLDKVIAAYRRSLTTLRATAGMGVEDLSIVLATPGPMNDVFFGRDEVYFHRLSAAMREMALEFQCAYIDIYGMYTNSWGGVGDWYDADTTSGVARSVHPDDALYEHIAGAIADLVLPDEGMNWKANAVRNTSGTSVNRLTADAPQLYFAGIHLDRMGDGTGFSTGRPYNGAVQTIKQADGLALQISYPINGQGAGISTRVGFNGAWQGHWNGAVYDIATLSYQNGWADLGSGFEIGSYKLTLSGTVELAGVISAGTTTDSTLLFTLPVGFRPTQKVLALIATENGTAKITVETNGEVFIFGFGAGGSYISLNGTSFPVY